MTTVAASADAVAAEARAWIAGAWDPDLSLLEWRRRLVDARWAVPSWPSRWFGRDLPAWADDVVQAELRAAGAVGIPVGGGTTLAGPTILAHGPDAARERFLAALLTGEHTWCQLFSEPGAGSDLAGLTTTAVRDGERWIVNGQKVWNTSADHADFGILVARTDWDVPKHRGLSYFALPMRQPGVEVRPLRQMNFHASFNEVFIADAEIPADHLIGEVGNGWAVALTTLAFERRFGVLMQRPRPSAARGRAVEEAEAEAAEHIRTYSWYPQRAGRADLAVPHARQAGRAGDPVVRQELARLHCLQRASAWTAERAKAARALGRPPGAEGSIGKLALSDLARQAARVHALLAGANGLLAGSEATAPFEGLVAEVLISVPAQSIAGGTDEIQRNIIGERVLGLPREPAPDRDRPFRDVPRNS
jgi:alkylation response protein AidB-like acyl-CoA dehydrogenase